MKLIEYDSFGGERKPIFGKHHHWNWPEAIRQQAPGYRALHGDYTHEYAWVRMVNGLDPILEARRAILQDQDLVKLKSDLR